MRTARTCVLIEIRISQVENPRTDIGETCLSIMAGTSKIYDKSMFEQIYVRNSIHVIKIGGREEAACGMSQPSNTEQKETFLKKS